MTYHTKINEFQAGPINEDTMILLADQIKIEKLEKKIFYIYTRCIFCDPSKTIETVDHKIIIFKSKNYGDLKKQMTWKLLRLRVTQKAL